MSTLAVFIATPVRHAHLKQLGKLDVKWKPGLQTGARRLNHSAQRVAKWADVLPIFQHRSEEIANAVQPFQDRSHREYGGIDLVLQLVPLERGGDRRPASRPLGVHGGEGSTTAGHHPVTPWGVPTLGYRTRKKNKASDRYIVRGRRRGKGKR